MKEYYNQCISKVLDTNPNARFIICTNQYDSILSNYLKSFPNNISYKIQNAANTDIDTLYIMSRCIGGICSNSTLSYMGSVFQRTKESIYMPYPFAKFIDGFNDTNIKIDMYPKWAKVYDTLQNQFMERQDY
jgi:hypothetical protein